jgi:hypothetical protein
MAARMAEGEFRKTKDIEQPTMKDLQDRDEAIKMLLNGYLSFLDEMVGFTKILLSVVDQLPNEKTAQTLKKELSKVPGKMAEAKSGLLERLGELGYTHY